MNTHGVGEIGYFQLNNLVQNKVPFTLFLIDLNREISQGQNQALGEEPYSISIDETVAKVMRSGKMISSQEFHSVVDALNLTLEHPFVLVCVDGVNSLSLAKQLVEKGFKNVYCIRGGLKALSSKS